jgi:formate-dependent nitrite reductase membrane component NrfD
MRNTNITARRSVIELTRGRVSGPFYLGTVLVGLVVPIAVGVAGFVHPLSMALLALVGVFSLVGDFFAKYTIVKSGIYIPVLPAGMTVAR